MGNRPAYIDHLEILNRLLRRSPFHDHGIEEITATNKRVLIRLDHMTLIITHATELTRCPLPTCWLEEKLTFQGSLFSLDIDTEEGQIHVKGEDIRLIRNSDLAILIPPVDT